MSTMYMPPYFQEDQVPVLHEAIRAIGFGTLVSLGADGLIASHVPMLIDPEPAPYGTLIGHVARANPHWQTAKAEVDALAMFIGPNCYVTPSFYATKRETGKVVPTWNYVAVHASGPLRFFDDRERLLGVVTRLTDTHEAGRANVWKVTDAPADYVQGMLRAIVGFALPIKQLTGKWKMSQNRNAADRAGVVDGLGGDGRPTQTEVARLVADAKV